MFGHSDQATRRGRASNNQMTGLDDGLASLLITTGIQSAPKPTPAVRIGGGGSREQISQDDGPSGNNNGLSNQPLLGRRSSSEKLNSVSLSSARRVTPSYYRQQQHQQQRQQQRQQQQQQQQHQQQQQFHQQTFQPQKQTQQHQQPSYPTRTTPPRGQRSSSLSIHAASSGMAVHRAIMDGAGVGPCHHSAVGQETQAAMKLLDRNIPFRNPTALNNNNSNINSCDLPGGGDNEYTSGTSTHDSSEGSENETVNGSPMPPRGRFASRSRYSAGMSSAGESDGETSLPRNYSSGGGIASTSMVSRNDDSKSAVEGPAGGLRRTSSVPATSRKPLPPWRGGGGSSGGPIGATPSRSNIQATTEEGEEENKIEEEPIPPKPPGVETFSILGGYPDVRSALVKRGWVEDKHRKSRTWDFRWTLKEDDVGFPTLSQNQIVNHFAKNWAVASKSSLAANLRRMGESGEAEPSSFFPRCHLISPDHVQEFIDDFTITEAVSNLRKFNPDQDEESMSLIKVAKLRYSLQIAKKYAKKLTDGAPIILNADERDVVLCGKTSDLPDSAIGKEGGKRRTLPAGFGEEAETTLDAIEEEDEQYDMNGSKNIWIVKPASLSRGRGIKLFSNLNELLAYAEDNKQGRMVVQKYIERPYLIQKKKFDIRQWVLVTSWKPLNIWFYNDCYLRFCTTDFTLKNLKNRYIHLCNRSVQKNCSEYKDTDIEGSMWSQEMFAEHLGESDWKQLQTRMKRAVITSLSSVKHIVSHRNKSFEVYGYDFVVDTGLKPWLIEINISPDMTHTTPILKRFVQNAIEDVIKVVVDRRKVKKKRGGKKKGNVDKDEEPESTAKPSTGRWVLIHKGKKEILEKE